MRILKLIPCFFGLHKPFKCITVVWHGKQFKRCKRCGKLLEFK